LPTIKPPLPTTKQPLPPLPLTTKTSSPDSRNSKQAILNQFSKSVLSKANLNNISQSSMNKSLFSSLSKQRDDRVDESKNIDVNHSISRVKKLEKALLQASGTNVKSILSKSIAHKYKSKLNKKESKLPLSNFSTDLVLEK